MCDRHLGRCMSSTVALKSVQPARLVLTLLTLVLVPTLTQQINKIEQLAKNDRLTDRNKQTAM